MKKENNLIGILIAIGAGIGVYYFLCNRFKNKENSLK